MGCIKFPKIESCVYAALAVSAFAVAWSWSTPAGAAEADDLADRFRKIVSASDLPALKALMRPTYDACATDANRAVYDDYISRVFAVDMKPGLKSAELRPITPEQEKRLYGSESTTYPVKASHVLIMNVNDPPIKEGASHRKLGETSIQYFAKRDGKWFLTFPCPTPEYFKKIAAQNALQKRARAVLAKLDPAAYEKIKAAIIAPSAGGMMQGLKTAAKALKDATGTDPETADMAARLIFFDSQ